MNIQNTILQVEMKQEQLIKEAEAQRLAAIATQSDDQPSFWDRLRLLAILPSLPVSSATRPVARKRPAGLTVNIRG